MKVVKESENKERYVKEYETKSYKGYDYKVKEIGFLIDVVEKYQMNQYWFCGYVQIPKEHEFYNKDYDDIGIDCHGGLTYSSMENNNEYWIGFDCNHYQDDPLINDYNYVEKECKKIIDSLFEEVKEEAKFKIGDRAIILNNLKNIENFKGGYVSELDKHINKIVTIRKIFHDGIIKVEENSLSWDERSLELVEEPTIDKITVNGIKVINNKPTESKQLIVTIDNEIIYQGKKEGNYMKILNIYEDKMASKINKEHEEKRKKILKEDENLKEYNKIKNLVEKYIEKLEDENIIDTLEVITELSEFDLITMSTEKTKKTLGKINEINEEKLKSLDTLIQEVSARLEISETEESKIEVLKLYEILDEHGKIKEVL